MLYVSHQEFSQGSKDNGSIVYMQGVLIQPCFTKHNPTPNFLIGCGHLVILPLALQERPNKPKTLVLMFSASKVMEMAGRFSKGMNPQRRKDHSRKC